MDFDLDDPLGDLLSDGSNDSFFGTTSKKASTSKATTSTGIDSKAKAKVADLFSIETDTSKPETAAAKSIIPPIQSKSETNIINRTPAANPIKSETPTKNSKSIGSPISKVAIEPVTPSNRKDIKFDESDDFLSELGFDPKNPKASLMSTKKSNILDDILNFSKPTTESQPKPITNTIPINKPVPEMEKKPNEPTSVRYSPSLGRPRNATRNASTSSANDPLGFFSTPTKKQPPKEKDEPNVVSNRAKLTKKPSVDWLGLTENTESEVEPLKIEKALLAPKAKENMETATELNVESVADAEKPIPNPPKAIPQEIIVPPSTLFNLSSMDTDRALTSLQNQGSQLRMAAQMKQQESVLLDVHTKQKSLLKQQETQFNQLLQRQIDRQNQLETQIQQQQEQINAYISILLNHSAAVPLNVSDSERQKSNDGSIMKAHDNIELEAELKRLELEKLRLEDVLQSVQSSHEQELDLLQTSHKKQVAILEENLEKLEQRFRTEIVSIETHHNEKFKVLSGDKEALQQKYEEQITKLVVEYEKQIEKLRTNHETEIESMKNDQRATIENIRQAKLYEFAAIHESSSYLNTLKSASDNLETATDNLQTMRANIDANIERVHAEREVQLGAREKRLNDQQTNIDKMMENTEVERTRLIELVHSLEVKLNSVEQSSTEEQWSLRQKSTTLDAERKSFEREKSFIREKLAAEEKRIHELKETHFAEHKRLLDSIDAERQQILVENAKLETMERLKVPLDFSAQRQNELDAAIRIAQDAAKRADSEREKLVELQQKQECRKRELIDKETQLKTKQSEMDLSINQAKDQKRAAEQITKSCKLLEQKFLAKLRSLQENFVELTNREMKLSQAKLELSKERMALQNFARQLRQSKCSLCRIGAQNREMSEMDPLNDIISRERLAPKINSIVTNPVNDFDSSLPNVDDLLTTESRLYNILPLLSPHKWDFSLMEAIDETPNAISEADLMIERMTSI